MDDATRKEILKVLGEHRIMTLATLRPDGWPQADGVVARAERAAQPG